MWTWLVVTLAFCAIAGALAGVGWYTGQAPTARPGKVATYLVGSVGILAFAWALMAVLHTVQ